MISSPRIRNAFVLSLFILCILILAFNGYPSIATRIPWPKNSCDTPIPPTEHRPNLYRPPANISNDIQPANATLGFGAVYVVSGPKSTRRDHLIQAANVTELELTIPVQKEWGKEDVQNFRGGKSAESSHVGEGSIKAWLSHHLALQAFLDSEYESALIIEDDLDWDVHLRITQIPRAQQAMRNLLSTAPQDSGEYPWGRPSSWDLLWIGHCGDFFKPHTVPIGIGRHHPEDLLKLQHIMYKDNSLVSWHDAHPWTASLLVALGAEPHHRIIHQSVFPLCTFAYAVTKFSARRLLDVVAAAKEELNAGSIAYDVALLSGCRDELIRCWTVNPQLFQHFSGGSVIGKEEGNPFIPEVAVVGSEQEYYRGESSNIQCGFRSAELYFDGNAKRLEDLRTYVRNGECPKPGRH